MTTLLVDLDQRPGSRPGASAILLQGLVSHGPDRGELTRSLPHLYT